MTPEQQKEIDTIKEQVDPVRLTPRVINEFIKKRSSKTNYVGGGNTLECDTMLEVEWNGNRYRLPAFRV